ncbi:IS66 family insertion sequence element accessory protein TnpB [Acinetobacter portensis]|uniref:IS66 family insertion sequence element accessory protein TnpB n=1 Tax=Acinetobacter portensis TaxID=1839785 RepID=A0ABY4JW10_9GAMM|nr:MULTISPECIES: IS66 family insertion sequence element accessory protein TnpB [Acinetobacter]MCK7609049.1 IS66 family insertion sequence element accessory protein TnpB [Acinetobacter portensis]MCK7639863.1 IS66 family insertion sequence element accessory protein TnpB [Acinetobacter portensis]MDY6530946.1 IS66 family insertion sequence element accessory protein TnpB [Acinetobacter faecalis]UPO23194.1 IS66 family insertion sequence element accessory protein TnpB [Acinetobacter portensis]
MLFGLPPLSETNKAVQPLRRNNPDEHEPLEAKKEILCLKAPNVSIASVALQHGLNTNLVSKWIRLIDAKPGNDRSPLPNKPAFIALSCSAPLDPTPTDMLTVQITLPHSKAEIDLKWQVSEISALAELLKALAT